MSRFKVDGVIEVVHNDPTGQMEWARAYERRGSAFSDLLIISRSQLVVRLKAGKIFVIGRRIPYLAGTFETGKRLRLVQQGNNQWLTTGDHPVEKDALSDAPVV
jgi:hypothetical protein